MKIPQIPKKRLALYVLVMAVMPIAWLTYSIGEEFDRCSLISERIQSSLARAQIISPLLMKHSKNIKMLHGKDPEFVNKNLETFIPLSLELQQLKERAQRGFLPDEEPLRRRLEFLNSGQNGLTFVEGALVVNKGFKETIETQTKQVEMSPDDLAAFISRIEGQGDDPLLLSRPQLEILECRIERKKLNNPPSNHEVYLFTSKLLKRECIE